MKRSVVVVLAAAATLAGCSAGTGQFGAAEEILARYDLDGLDAVEIVEHLDRLGADERPADLMASVRPDELVLSSGREELSLDIPGDRFYVSVAPYVDQTHDCFYHSLTTCQGELVSKDVRVQVLDEASGEVLVDETRTTFENGFVGLWLPRDIEGTVRVTHDGRVGEVDFATDAEAPTCVTTLQLA